VVDYVGEEGDCATEFVKYVATPADLTGIGIRFSSLYEGLYGDGYRRVRTGIYTLAPLLAYTENLRTVYRFLHTLTGRIRTADGVGVCAIDPCAVEDRTLNSLVSAFDGRLSTRTGPEGCEIRVQGLAGQPDGWLDWERS